MRVALYMLLLMSAILSCNRRDDEPTFKDYHALFSQPPHEVWRLFNTIVSPEPVAALQLDSGWVYWKGSATEGLNTREQMEAGEPVTLPHRVQLPDTPLWYTNTAHFAEPGYLLLSADDGAQLYMNGTRIARDTAGAFMVPVSERVRLTVRVLNNAMSGGLRAVRFVRATDMEAWRKEVNRHEALETLATQVALMNTPCERCERAVVAALKSPSAENIRLAREQLDPYPLITGPYLIRQSDTVWIVHAEATRQLTLRWGKAGEKKSELHQGEGMARFQLRNIRPGTTYEYQLAAGKSVSKIYKFTAEVETDTFSFNIWADSQAGWPVFSKLVSNTMSSQDAFGVAVGDLVGNGSDRGQWRKFLSILAPVAAGRPYYLVPGNHDYDGFYDDLQPRHYLHYTSYVPARYFFWTYGNVACVALDPNATFPIGIAGDHEQLAWLTKVFESDGWKDATWRFVFLHQTLYSQGWAGYHGDQSLRDVLEPAIERNKIDFIVSGHTHDYEHVTRTYGDQTVTFLVAGGAGGSPEPPESSTAYKMDTIIKQHHIVRFQVRGASIDVTAIDTAGAVIDSFTRNHKP